MSLTDLKQGGRGFLLTCEGGRERQTRSQMQDWLNDHIERLSAQGSAKDEDLAKKDGGKVLDIERELAAEIAEQKTGQLIVPVDLHGGAGCVVLALTKHCLLDPVDIARSLYTEFLETKKSRAPGAFSLCPCQAFGFVTPEDVVKAGQHLLPKHFGPGCDTKSFAIQFRRRFLRSLKRDKVIEAFDAALVKLWPEGAERELKANLTNPQVVIMVEAIKNVCGISVIPDFPTMHRLSLRFSEAEEEELGLQTECTGEKEPNKSSDTVDNDNVNTTEQSDDKAEAGRSDA